MNLSIQPSRSGAVRKRVISGVLSYGVVGLVMWLLVEQLITPAAAAAALGSISVVDVMLVCVLGLVYMATRWPPIVATLPGLRYPQAMVTKSAATALENTVPEGSTVAAGLNFAILRSWGFRISDITSSILTTGIWTSLTRYTLMAIGLVLLVLEGDAAASVLWLTASVVLVVAVAIVVFVLILRNEAFARRLGRIANAVSACASRVAGLRRIPDMEGAIVVYRVQLLDRIRSSWRALTVAMLVSQLTACVILGVSLRLMDVDRSEVGWPKIIVAFTAMGLASVVVPTPGGLGVAEATLVAILGAGLSVDLDAELVASVVLFRIATWLLPIPIGLVAYLYWRKSRRWRGSSTNGVANSTQELQDSLPRGPVSAKSIQALNGIAGCADC